MDDQCECRIVEMNGDEFTAQIFTPDGYEFVADFKVADLPVGDGEPLEVGDVFWAPAMKLIHPEPLTEQQIAAAYARADELMERLADLCD